jgi:hypothetical protein
MFLDPSGNEHLLKDLNIQGGSCHDLSGKAMKSGHVDLILSGRVIAKQHVDEYVFGPKDLVHSLTRKRLPRIEKDVADAQQQDARRQQVVDATSSNSIEQLMNKAAIRTSIKALLAAVDKPTAIQNELDDAEKMRRWKPFANANKTTTAQALSRWKHFGAWSKRVLNGVIRDKTSELNIRIAAAANESSPSRRVAAVAALADCDLRMEPGEGGGRGHGDICATIWKRMQERRLPDIEVGERFYLKQITRQRLSAECNARGPAIAAVRALASIRRQQRHESERNLRADEMEKRRGQRWTEGFELVEAREAAFTARAAQNLASAIISPLCRPHAPIPPGIVRASFRQARATAAARRRDGGAVQGEAAAELGAAAVAAAGREAAQQEDGNGDDGGGGGGGGAAVAVNATADITPAHVSAAAAYIERLINDDGLNKWTWSKQRMQNILVKVGMAGVAVESDFAKKLKAEITNHRRKVKKRGRNANRG